MAEDALEIAIRAQEAARAAHHRLDRMNGSIDRLASEVADAKAEILKRLDTQDGAATARQRFHADARFWVATLAVLAAAVLGALLAHLLH